MMLKIIKTKIASFSCLRSLFGNLMSDMIKYLLTQTSFYVFALAMI